MKFLDDVTVELIKHNVSDADVAAAAWVSTSGEKREQTSEKIGRTAGLINFLMRDRHGTPFEHGSMTFFVKAPIFVFREFHRHRAGWSYNEESGRYKELEPEFYVPNTDRNLVQTGKPGAYTLGPGDKAQHFSMRADLEHLYEEAYLTYQDMLGYGIAKEVARMVLPVGIFSSMYATANPRALMHFLSLRNRTEDTTVPTFPQREIEMVAEKLEVFFQHLMPYTYEAFIKNGRVAP